MSNESISTKKPKIEVHFDNIVDAIVKYIKCYDLIKVCCAWFTCPLIIEALGERDSEVIVGSTEFLTKGHPEYREKLASELIMSLGKGNVRVCVRDKITKLTEVVDEGIVHNKFMIFYKYEDSKPVPCAVITGSYNYTVTARNNKENIIYVEDKLVAEAYDNDYAKIRLKTKALT